MKVNGKLCYIWRAVDPEGEVLETVVTVSRDKAPALKVLTGRDNDDRGSDDGEAADRLDRSRQDGDADLRAAGGARISR